MAVPTLTIFFHDRCFDGASSAALFAEFYKKAYRADAQIRFEGLSHSKDDPFVKIQFEDDENACLDFRYCPDLRMNWWFDHHASAFQPSSLAAHFKDNQNGQKFYDPKARSCALFLLSVLKENFEFQLEDPEGHWQELLGWADRIDGAVFQSAEEIVELKAPALQLMTWLKAQDEGQQIEKLIPSLGHVGLEEVLGFPWIKETLAPLMEKHLQSISLIEKRLERKGRVVSYDLSRDAIDAHNGFIAYMLCPESTYSVGLVDTGKSINLSVGHNPWSSNPGRHDIAKLCEQYGGGGHPHVGGISLPAGEIVRAREIVEELGVILDKPSEAAMS